MLLVIYDGLFVLSAEAQDAETIVVEHYVVFVTVEDEAHGVRLPKLEGLVLEDGG